MIAHTHGLWLIRKGDEWTHDVVTYQGANIEGEPMYWTVASANSRRDEVDANLRLIAAAPDLLEALQNIIEGGCTSSALRTASAAIAKATQA